MLLTVHVFGVEKARVLLCLFGEYSVINLRAFTKYALILITAYV